MAKRKPSENAVRGTTTFVIGQFKVMEDKSCLVLLAGNEPLQRLVNAWPRFRIAFTPNGQYPDGDPTDKTAEWFWWMWDQYRIDDADMRAAVGRGPDVDDLARQAMAGMLVWPDGTINGHAAPYLSRLAQAHIFGIGSQWHDPQRPQRDDDD